jgi:hypothetical protein
MLDPTPELAADLAAARGAWAKAREARICAEEAFAHADREEDEAWEAYEALSPELPAAREAYRKGQAARNERLYAKEALECADREEDDAEQAYLDLCAAAGCEPDW